MVSLGKKARKVLRQAASKLSKNSMKKDLDSQVGPGLLWSIDKPELPHDDADMTDADKITTGKAEERAFWDVSMDGSSSPRTEFSAEKSRRILKGPNHSDSLDPCPVPAKILPLHATIDPVPDIPTPRATPREFLRLSHCERATPPHSPSADASDPRDLGDHTKHSDIDDCDDGLSDHNE